MNFVIGFDLDGVIDRYPESVRWLTNLLLHSGHEVHVITGRREAVDWDFTLEQLRKLKIRFTGLHLYPDDYELKLPLKRDVAQAVGRWKAEKCRELGVELFFDDQIHSYLADFTPVRTVHV